jgi:hypothetical protein
MKRLPLRGVTPGIIAVLSIAFIIAACAPTPAGPPPETTTTTSGVTTTTLADTVPDCTPGAVGTVTLGENPVDVEPGNATATNLIDVCWNLAGGAGRAVYIEQCYEPASLPGFNISFHCFKNGEVQINPAANPTNTGHKEFKIFRGAEPSGDNDWGCFAPGDTVPPETLRPFYDCYIRVTLDSFANNAEAKSIQFQLLP